MKMVISARKSGTADKITAFVEIMVGENPIANMRSLDALLGMVTSKFGKRFILKGLKALSQILIRHIFLSYSHTELNLRVALDDVEEAKAAEAKALEQLNSMSEKTNVSRNSTSSHTVSRGV